MNQELYITKMNFPYQLILASKSPRRQSLLKSLDLDFDVRVQEVDESYPDDILASEVPQYLAVKKADAYNLKDSNELLLTSDTVVNVDNQVLGKAKTPNECLSMLALLSGRAHEVITGVCLKSNLKKISFDETTVVHFKALSEQEMSYYIEKYNPFDKAGAYGIQEWIGMVGIERIEGDYYNVMGLPLHKLYQALQKNFSQ
jgi:septum formation protein